MNYKKGIRFKCQGSSNCCVSRGSYGYVYLSQKDIKRLSQNLKLEIDNFIKIYCDKTNGFIHLKESNKNGDCQFLKNKRCSVYLGRPTQCRTWPFWSENMNAKTWNKEISKFCPGVGKGKIITDKQIKKKISLDEKNENEMLNEIN
jgi:Fe-S-cluster containining protein